MTRLVRLPTLLPLLAAVLALPACQTVDWPEAGRQFLAAGCRGLPNCGAACPSDTRPTGRIDRCEAELSRQ